MSSTISSDLNSKMNVVASVKTYITKMTEDSGPGMKVLLLDKQTTSIVSVVYSQSEMLQKEVYLFERIDSGTPQESVKYLKCIVFMRPTKENISLLASELKFPRYSSYYIYLSNIISKADIKYLAESDEQEVVKEIQEYYADYLAVSPHLFSFGIPYIYKDLNWNSNHLERTIQGITSVLLSLKKYPIIRYYGRSQAAKRLSEGIRNVLTKESSLFSFGSQETYPILLVLDRKEDPVTPLLNQWTYQAMVHELLTITNDRVSLTKNPEKSEEVLSPEQDNFYASNLYKNFGEIGQKLKELMDEYQKQVKSHQKVETIADMKNVVQNYPQIRKKFGTVLKHVNVVEELSELVSKYSLMDVSELEQEIVIQDEHSQQLERIKSLISNPSVREIDAVRLVLLYALRYKRHPKNDLNGLEIALKRKGVSDRFLDMIGRVTSYADDVKQEVFGQGITVEKITKRFFDLKGVENAFTRHTPLLKETLEELIKGKLKENIYPYLNGTKSQIGIKARDIIVFIVGGVTYAESLAVHQLNRSNKNISILQKDHRGILDEGIYNKQN
ncbi:UNVERIFIED_CONTAM: hypothetical protein PYX00_006672 [Menopon gallinae]|uniref:Vacuolar protein sorting-associated protein 45 n=1 Tax=Menopon gallinae TaxID=328185 RepID=A0AAW2HX41_9NEOP